MTKYLAPIALSAVLSALAPPTDAGVRVYVRVAPPAPLIEARVVAPGPGYVWVSGFQRWDGKAYVWVSGRWERPPAHHRAWVSGHWVHRARHGWYWVEGHWVR